MVPCEIIIEEIKTFHKLDTVNPWHIFYNYKKGQGTRLTKQGFTLLQPMFDSYKILLDKEHAVKSKHLIILQRSMTFPYYITRTAIWVFSEQDAFMLKLNGGDIEHLGQTSGVTLDNI
jgi:hypothetical protein